MSENDPKMMPELIFGLKSMDQFLEIEEKVTLYDAMTAEDDLVGIEDALKKGETTEVGVAFLRGFLQGIIDETPNKLHEVELAKSQMKVFGKSPIAVEVLDKRIAFYEDMERMMVSLGKSEEVEELRKIIQVLILLREDQVE